MKKKTKKAIAAAPKKATKKTIAATPKKATSRKSNDVDKNESANQNKAAYTFPDLPLSDTWYHFADLMRILKVSRPTLDRYIKSGMLFKHKWGGTRRFNKSYVDWMIQGNRGKLSWFIALITSAESFGIVASLTEIV